MILCCYNDDNGNQHFEQRTSVQDFSDAHPGITPAYIFNMESELNLHETIQRKEFDKYCNRFGFDSSDYGKHLLASNDEECILVGFLPQNRKYTVQFQRVSDGHSYKATPNATKHGILRYENLQKIKF